MASATPGQLNNELSRFKPGAVLRAARGMPIPDGAPLDFRVEEGMMR